MATKNAQWQATFRRRQREAGLKSVTVWMPKEGADRLARYPEKERGEIITRALMLLESRGELTGNYATLTGKLTGEVRDEGEASVLAQAVAGLSARLEQVEALLSTITSNSTRELTGNEPPGPQATLPGESTRELTGEAANECASITGESTDKSTGEVAVTVTEPPRQAPAKTRGCPYPQGQETVCPGGELEGDCPAVERRGYPDTHRHREMAWVDCGEVGRE